MINADLYTDITGLIWAQGIINNTLLKNIKSIEPYFFRGRFNTNEKYEGIVSDNEILFIKQFHVDYGVANSTEITFQYKFQSSDIVYSQIRRPVVSFDIGLNDLHASDGWFYNLLIGFVGLPNDLNFEPCEMIGYKLTLED